MYYKFPQKPEIKESDVHKGIHPMGQRILFWNNGILVSGNPKSYRALDKIEKIKIELSRKPSVVPLRKRLTLT